MEDLKEDLSLAYACHYVMYGSNKSVIKITLRTAGKGNLVWKSFSPPKPNPSQTLELNWCECQIMDHHRALPKTELKRSC